jgi:sodium-independent sulfate anion transporter 11
VIWVIGVFVTMFSGLETSIHVTIGLFLLFLLVRLARTNGRILGRVPLQPRQADMTAESSQDLVGKCKITTGTETRDVCLPMNREDASHPAIAVTSPYSCIFIYHFPEGLNYLNQASHFTALSTHIFSHTKRTIPPSIARMQDALCCDSSASLGQDTRLPCTRIGRTERHDIHSTV